MAVQVITRPSKLRILAGDEHHAFTVPVKKINEGHDVSTFLTSKAYSDIMTFLLQLNASMFPQIVQISSEKVPRVQRWELGSASNSFSSVVLRLRNLLDDLENIINEVPPDRGPRRFGNVSFRRWFEIVEKQCSALLERYLPNIVLSSVSESDVGAMIEIESFFLGSFGSPQRLDYGSGHELSFLAFLGCIWKLGGFETADPGVEERAIVFGVVEPYLNLIRKLIKTYTLEPAGSHGVWGLDDHFFIPYIFGSAQYSPALSDNNQIPTEGSCQDAPNPAEVAKAAIVEKERLKNMYFSAVGFIYDVKRGPFWEHSPMLYDISGVQAGWAKINKGMLKMYSAEVLSKFPVVQHFRFGFLFSWDQDPDASAAPMSVHATTSAPGGSKASIESVASMPNRPQYATKTPWVTSSPDSNANNATPRLRERRFDAIKQITKPPHMKPSRFPHQGFPDTSQLVNPEVSNSAVMPPPTRAPWAKQD